MKYVIICEQYISRPDSWGNRYSYSEVRIVHEDGTDVHVKTQDYPGGAIAREILGHLTRHGVDLWDTDRIVFHEHTSTDLGLRDIKRVRRELPDIEECWLQMKTLLEPIIRDCA